MLTDVFAVYLGDLDSERAFDAPFLSLLRSMGYEEIQCVHGTYEYGKDFIAKKTVEGLKTQFLFQTKNGDVGKSSWDNDLQPQCEKMAYSGIVHPSFDESLPRRVIAVSTGKLKGQAPTLVEQYKKSVEARYPVLFEFWTRDTLAEQFARSANELLTATASDTIEHYRNWGRLFSFIEDIEAGKFSFRMLERVSSDWSLERGKSAFKATVELLFARQQLRSRGLRLHATLLTLAFARAIAADLVGCEEEVLDYEPIIRRLFLQDVDEILDWHQNVPEEEKPLSLAGIDPMETFIASTRLFHWMEFVSLGVLCEPKNSERNEKAKAFLGDCLSKRCTTKPLGDRFAVSILVTTLAASKLSIAMQEWLQDIVVWVCDNAESDALGLASPRESAKEQLWRTAGACLEDPAITRRDISSIGAAVLDACSLLGFCELYNDAMNDLLAVGVIPFSFTPIEGSAQYYIGYEGVLQQYGGNYSAEWVGEDGWKNAAIHHRADVEQECDRLGLSWLGAAASLVLRDRWWIYGLRQLWLQ